MTVQIHGILSENADIYWPFISEWCEDALSRAMGDLLNLDDVKAAVAKQEMQLWVIYNNGKITATCVTEIRTWPRTKVLTAIIVAGRGMDEWVRQLDALLTAFGAANGCKMLDAHGRSGWKKPLAELGWQQSVVTYAKGIENGKE